MKIIVTGSTGLIGSTLVPTLIAAGHTVTRFVRASSLTEADGTRAVVWNPRTNQIEKSEIETHDAVIHLAGESVAEGRWTEDKKRRILESRVESTRLLASAIAEATTRPRVYISASATGFYGNERADEVLTEQSAKGTDFLAHVVEQWEASAQPVIAACVRCVFLRFGIVLSEKGGALLKLLTPFKLGAGGKIGSGEQYMSWVAMDDAIAVIMRALEDESLSGAVNVVAPYPVTNAEFTETLARVLHRPAVFTVPAFALRLAFGEMADAALLKGQRVIPEKLETSGFKFKYPKLETALRSQIS
ncbi:MAG: TIGR01777 family oxidoreductase [Pyrinomonadaceae bacterium MAG19_C2-C3]|nr:TIGR01777 family oxidoreductase [Pyrinomonadaceae bacterium MAG19_C2-C3]